MYKIGVHFTIAKGFTYAIETVFGLGGNTFQFFSRNPRGSSVKVYDEKDIEKFRRFREEHRFGPLMAHAPYTINMAGVNEDILSFSREAVKDDMIRMEKLGIEYYNLHPGNHMGAGEEAGIVRIAEGLNRAIDGNQRLTVLLETMSGKGSEIGWRFEQLRNIMDRVECGSKIGVCMDLCHMFSSGYDIVNETERVFREFDGIIGLEKLKAVHLNDSANPFGSRKDNHAPIGEGRMGKEATVKIMGHPAVRRLPFYLETPLDDEGHRLEIAMLRKELAQAHR